jgi:hypothetical protein
VSLGVSIFALAHMKTADAEGEAFLRSSFARINAALARRGLPEHHEPETRTAHGDMLRGTLANMSYATFRTLGRQLVRCRWGGGKNYDPRTAREEEKARVRLASHLFCHAENGGFYVPVDFAEPLYASFDEPVLPGGLVGSSQRLLGELAEVGPHLGVDPDHPEVASGQHLQEGWHTLYTRARVSVEHGTAIWLQ